MLVDQPDCRLDCPSSLSSDYLETSSVKSFLLTLCHSAFLITITLTLASDADAGDWTQWRGNDRNGVASDSPSLLGSLPEDGLKATWISEPIGSGKNEGGWGSPVVVNFPGDKNAEQRVYLFTHRRVQIADPPEKKFPWLSPDKRVGMSDAEYAEYEVKRRDEDEAIAKAFVFRETIYCLNAADGQEIWKNENDSVYTRFPQSGSPTVVDGRLYILGAGGHVRSVDALSGKSLWKVRLPVSFRDEFWQSSLLIVDDLAIFLAGHLYAVSLEDGSIVWEGDPRKTSGTHTSPVLWHHDGTNFVVLNAGNGTSICVEAATGKEAWSVKSEAGLSTPVISGDRLITYSNSRKKGMRCFKLSTDGAEEQWVFNGCQDKGSSPVVVGDYVYVQGEKRLACVNLETGDAEWMTTLDLGQPQYTSLVAADSKVYYALEGVLCVEATPEEFRPLFNAKIDEAGLLNTEDALRELHGINALAKENQGQAEKLYQSKIGKHGPLQCATPAIADGKIYVRLKNALACYSLLGLE
jgi:outer membrane protein assembly factor BamB